MGSKTGVVVAVFEGAGGMVAVADDVGANVAVWEMMETGVGVMRGVPCPQAVRNKMPMSNPIVIRFMDFLLKVFY
jgi:hypothetical protein